MLRSSAAVQVNFNRLPNVFTTHTIIIHLTCRKFHRFFSASLLDPWLPARPLPMVSWMKSFNTKLTIFAPAGQQQDLVVIGGGPGGYVAAIKAAQLGLKVITWDCWRWWLITRFAAGHLCGETRLAGWNLSECGLYSVESIAKQYSFIPSSTTWFWQAWYWRWFVESISVKL